VIVDERGQGNGGRGALASYTISRDANSLPRLALPRSLACVAFGQRTVLTSTRALAPSGQRSGRGRRRGLRSCSDIREVDASRFSGSQRSVVAERTIAACPSCPQEMEPFRPIIQAFAARPTDRLRPSTSLWARLAQPPGPAAASTRASTAAPAPGPPFRTARARTGRPRCRAPGRQPGDLVRREDGASEHRDDEVQDLATRAGARRPCRRVRTDESYGLLRQDVAIMT
jgi:hypothetical protein